MTSISRFFEEVAIPSTSPIFLPPDVRPAFPVYVSIALLRGGGFPLLELFLSNQLAGGPISQHDGDVEAVAFALATASDISFAPSPQAIFSCSSGTIDTDPLGADAEISCVWLSAWLALGFLFVVVWQVGVFDINDLAPCSTFAAHSPHQSHSELGDWHGGVFVLGG